MFQQQRRKKKRPFRPRRIDLERKSKGFGFSIIGESPCIVSSSSVDDLLTPGDCLISVEDMTTNGGKANPNLKLFQLNCFHFVL